MYYLKSILCYNKLSQILFFVFFVFTLSISAQTNYKPFANSKFIYVDGVKYHYREWNPENKSLGNFLLIHGFSGSTFCWRKNIDSLVSLGYKVVALDVPPFGFSDHSINIDYSTSKQCERIWQLIEKLGSGKWNLIGHSMGASVVGAMAAINPEKTAKLIFVDGPYFGIRSTTWKERLSGYIISTEIFRSLANDIGKIAFYKFDKFHNLLESAYSCPPDSEAVIGYLEPFLKNKEIAGAIIKMATANEKETIGLPKNIPTLIIWGKKDKWIDISVGKKMTELYPQAFFKIINEAGHCSMETNPTEFNNTISDFLLLH
jgi:pimeloyl-ACP methyl ester carboxylesterase